MGPNEVAAINMSLNYTVKAVWSPNEVADIDRCYTVKAVWWSPSPWTQLL